MDTIPAPLKGKVALVTGGSRGIGAGIAETFARQGCTHIAITYTSKPDLAEGTLAAIKAINSTIKTFAFQCDVKSPECGRFVVEQTLLGLGVNHIDIMVSNAALVDMSQQQTIEDTTYEGFMEMITGNTWTPFLLARESARVMPSGGRIILISSVNSKLAHGDPSLGYGTAKAGMDAVSLKSCVRLDRSLLTTAALRSQETLQLNMVPRRRSLSIASALVPPRLQLSKLPFNNILSTRSFLRGSLCSRELVRYKKLQISWLSSLVLRQAGLLVSSMNWRYMIVTDTMHRQSDTSKWWYSFCITGIEIADVSAYDMPYHARW